MAEIDEETRRRIDDWIKKNGLNEYGDARGAMYAGGTPLVHPLTGAKIDRYDYILSRHPELRKD